jgi:hypothetical protein
MAYRVELAKNAEAELEELYLWIIERASNQGPNAIVAGAPTVLIG